MRQLRLSRPILFPLLLRLPDGDVPLPALVLEGQPLERDARGIGIERGKGLGEGGPAAVDLAGERELARLVQEFERDVPAEVGKPNLASASGRPLARPSRLVRLDLLSRHPLNAASANP